MKKKLRNDIILFIMWFIAGIIALIDGITPFEYMCIWFSLLAILAAEILEDKNGK